MKNESPAAEQRALLRKVEELVQQIERSGEEEVPIHAMVEAIVKELRDELGIYGARLYERFGDDYVLRVTFPGGNAVDEVFRVPRTYTPIELCLMLGIVYMEADDPRLDPELESALGVKEFAAVEVASERYLIGFNVAPGHHHENIIYSLGVVRHAINQKIREQEMTAIFRQARKIQTSILPKKAPVHGVYDIAGTSKSLDSVGGDLFDFIPIHDKILGVAIADASGHGFPAALQVRDVYMGLRMGMARDLKIVRTVERLNQIIHHSTLTSRFVSMFYGELEVNGLFIYVNAGHPAPFYLCAETDKIHYLEEGGPILGPLSTATYDRGFVRLQPGDLLVIYTDGLTEAHPSPEHGGDPDEEYGVRRLQEVARKHRHGSARSVIKAIFEDQERWTGGGVPEDDRTVVVVRYPPED